MKKTIIFLITIILISSTSKTDVIITKPATPIKSITRAYSIYDRDQMILFIDSCTKEGYVVKQINGAGSDSWWFVTLEKY